MTPGFELALAIGLVVGFAPDMAFARSFPTGAIGQRGDGPFSNPRALD